MRRTKEDAELTRQLLLKSALTVFAERGYTNTRLSDIAEKAGVTRGAIYWHFGNKRELLIDLVKNQVDPYFEIIAQVVSESISARKKLEKILRIILEKFNNDREFLANHKFNFVELKMKNEIPEIKEFIKRKFLNFRTIIQKLVETGISTGEFRRINPDSITAVFATIVAGCGAIAMNNEISLPIDQDYMIDILLNGISPDNF